jgi:hypothetical protein
MAESSLWEELAEPSLQAAGGAYQTRHNGNMFGS